MFYMLRSVCELTLGSPLSLSHESFNYIFSNLRFVITQLIQQSFSIALRAKRTRLLGEDFKLILKCRAISPLYGYCCTTKDTTPPFETVPQGGHVLFARTDIPISLKENYFTVTNTSCQNKNFQEENIEKKCIVSCEDILLHVEWLAIAGEQNYPPVKSLVSVLNTEQQLYLSFLQSNNFKEEIWNFLRYDQIALNTILSKLIEWCRHSICECLIHSCRLKKRCQLASYLTIVDCLLENPFININHYLHILSPIIMTCLLYEFEIDEPLDCDNNCMKSAINTGHVWSLRYLASGACVKMLQRSNSLVYDIFYIRIISKLICSLTDRSSPPSTIHAILCLFEQLGVYPSRTFLLPYLLHIDSSKIFSSKSILGVLERIAMMIVEK